MLSSSVIIFFLYYKTDVFLRKVIKLWNSYTDSYLNKCIRQLLPSSYSTLCDVYLCDQLCDQFFYHYQMFCPIFQPSGVKKPPKTF